MDAFYKVFWGNLKNIILGVVHQIFKDKQLPITLRLGIIALIPWGLKDRRYIANWRPLMLLETLYKLLSTTLALRLKWVLDILIGAEQKAYIPGQFILSALGTPMTCFTLLSKITYLASSYSSTLKKSLIAFVLNSF